MQPKLVMRMPGDWEAGELIDTTKNKDGQPAVITGELYGKHFKVFVDSMKAAASALGNTIYIGGQVIHYDATSSPFIAERKWNEGFFKEGAPYADFYLMHNYYGNNGTTAKSLLDAASTELKSNIDFIRQDIKNKNAPDLPVAITEWNMKGSDPSKISVINGMQSVILFCDMLKQSFGLSSRWPIANYEADGMFYSGSNTQIPAWNPRPDFFYAYYLPYFIGDHMVSTVSGNKDLLAYSSTFASGHTGIVIVNKLKTDQVVKLLPKDYGFGSRFYLYSLTGGTDNGEFSQMVSVNDNAPTAPEWGPIILKI